jgi:hypothetical protein
MVEELLGRITVFNDLQALNQLDLPDVVCQAI